ncbi:MAG: hypothetical protein AAGF11_04020 [Myxococcota bacterium]
MLPIVLLSAVSLACGPSILLPSEEGGGTSNGSTDGPGSATDTGSSPPAPASTGALTTSTTVVTTTGLDTGGESTGITFIGRPDISCFTANGYYTSCFECGVLEQDCPNGEKCMPWANDGGMRWNSTRCVPIIEQPDQPGEPCMVEGSPFIGVDSCDLGSMCWGVDLDTNEGTCISMCAGDPSNPMCELPENSCFLDEDQSLALCLSGCNPLGDDCGPSGRCVPTEQGLGCFHVWSAGAAAGQPCEYLDECGPGLACTAPDAVAPSCDPGASGCCTPWCDLSAPDPSAACFDPTQQCTSWWDGAPAPDGLEDLGICQTIAP